MNWYDTRHSYYISQRENFAKLLQCYSQNIVMVNFSSAEWSKLFGGHRGKVKIRQRLPISDEHYLEKKWSADCSNSHILLMEFEKIPFLLVAATVKSYPRTASIFCREKDHLRLLILLKREIRSLIKLVPPVLPGDLVEDIKEYTLGFLKKRMVYESLGVRLSRGVIFYGEPGNGKTMMCRYLKQLATLAQLEDKTVGAADIRRGISDNDLEYYCSGADLIFFDDININMFNRQADGEVASDMLGALDGMDDRHCCVRIFTTNEETQGLDPAFLRPGRVDRCIKFPLPTQELKRELVTGWPEEIRDMFDVDELLEKCGHFSFAELTAVKINLIQSKISDLNWSLDHCIDLVTSTSIDFRKKIGL